MLDLDCYKVTKVITQLKNRIKQDEVPALGAQLTYYLILSFFPFLIFLITILSYTTFSSEDFIVRLSTILPKQSFDIVYDVIKEVVDNGSTSLLSFSIIGTLWSASNGVAAMIKGLNKSYNQNENRSFFKLRGYGILITIALSLGIILAFTLLVFGEVLGNYIFNALGLSYYFKIFWNIVRLIFPIFLLILVFILFYKFAPNKKLKIKDVFPGAIFSTFSWITISLVFSYYVNNFSNYTKVYGSIGGIIILLIWLYISSIIVLIGGELNATLSYVDD
ncbi:YihY/virulence factor BrkB family protein [Clostridium sp. D2Q-14]|uniref:YihY/virulence factor BrkB family protein n=1 Tax=Anaeromonas gelatinilytica TaxID=2683194 RepID=UPI00193BD266|nr:YihY/virulence factor BrkB family protein [Anaeromonas gelatinilytica]MBS4536388.1 YihY/virulence factor BrkB family protein [Anaeromonas gelatinilytica]